LQKSALRIISNARYNSHSEPIFKKQEILPFEKMLLFFNLQFAHRFLNNHLPLLFKEVWQTNHNNNNGEFQFQPQNEHMQLRPRGTFKINFTRLSICEKFPFFSLPRTWNSFPNEEVKNITNKIEFNKKLKKLLIDELSDNVVCNRLLCPTCHLQN